MPSKIPSWLAFVIYTVAMIGSLAWSTFKPTAPFGEFAWAFTAGFLGYVGKRLIQKKKDFQMEVGNGGDSDVEAQQ